jgi:hypothetical protein
MKNKQLKALDYCNETIILKEQLEEGFVMLGARFLQIRDQEMFKPQWTSFPEYLMEMKMSESTASKLISIHQKLVMECGLEPKQIAKAGGYTEVYEILPFVKDKKSAEEWLQKAETLTRDDLRKEITEEKTGISMAKCEHKHTRTIEICLDCKLRIDVTPEHNHNEK